MLVKKFREFHANCTLLNKMPYLKCRDHKLIFSFQSVFLHRQKETVEKAEKAFLFKKLMPDYVNLEDFEKDSPKKYFLET